MIVFRPTLRKSLAPLAMLLASFSLRSQTAAPSQLLTDATFAFSTDIHVSFDGLSDVEGIVQTQSPSYPLMNELKPVPGVGLVCVPNLKDLCNQISLVNKLNAIPFNSWTDTTFTQNSAIRKLAGAGISINAPLGVILGGDLTDCAGGSLACPLYGGENSPFVEDVLGITSFDCSNAYPTVCNPAVNTDVAQLQAFVSLFDKQYSFPFPAVTEDRSNLIFLLGLSSPNARLNYPIYPGLGNHDIDGAGAGYEVKNYIAEWNSSNSGSKKVSNSDPSSTSYSWDWGHLHIVNVGVFPGSDNALDGGTNYQFSQAATDWLAADLQQFAGDGRPVIIAAHFGFDSLSLSNSWWGVNSPRSRAIPALWPVLKRYNVIGYFHGHNHRNGNWYPFPNGTNVNEGGPAVSYDIFNSGPGFSQDFVISHVTDSNMDVMFTAEGTQERGSSVSFGSQPFTKILAPPPVVKSVYQMQAGQTMVASLNIHNTTYMIGAYTSYPTFTYDVQTLSSLGQPSSACKGTLSSMSAIQGMITYVAGDGSGHLLINLSDTVHDFRLGSDHCLVADWSSTVTKAQAMTMLNVSGKSYLIVESTSVNDGLGYLEIYNVDPSGLHLVAQSNALGPLPSDGQLVQLQRGTTVSGDSTLEIIGFNPQTGMAKFFLLDCSSLSTGSITATLGRVEQWAPGNITLLSNPNLSWPATGEELNQIVNISLTNSAESPLYVRTVVPLQTPFSNTAWTQSSLQSVESTDVSWRGSVFGFQDDISAAFPLGTTVTQNPVTIEAYSTSGTLTQLAIPWVHVY